MSMVTDKVTRLGLVLVLATFMPAMAMAQGVGAIGGSLTDSTGALLPGASVTLTSVEGTIGGNQQTVSNALGAYQFTRLVPGRYTVRAELMGFRPAVQENLVVDADATTRADLKLEVGQLVEGLVVSGQSPLVDTTSTLNQTVLSREILDTLPGRNDLWSLGRVTPGMLYANYDVGGTKATEQGRASVHGSSGYFPTCDARGIP